jgi:hypothetical protein
MFLTPFGITGPIMLALLLVTMATTAWWYW